MGQRADGLGHGCPRNSDPGKKTFANIIKAVDEDGNPISVWNPDEPETDSDGKGRVSQVELFYSNGDICDITGEPREVIVRLKVILFS